VLIALCVSGSPNRADAADAQASKKGKPFRLNTLPTTEYGPAWADIVLSPTNFLACKGASIALCYYSGPEAPAAPGAAPMPCDVAADGAANCTCFKIPNGQPYYVDINAILNLDVYLDTVNVCGHDGRECQPFGNKSAPVCDSINAKKFIPGAELISTFSAYLDKTYPLEPADTLACTSTPYSPYAGCMTAPCTTLKDPATGLPVVDPATKLELAQCACPTFTGAFQVGYPNGSSSCSLGGGNVWSAAYTVPPELPVPPQPPNGCWPDVQGGCPLLSPKPPQIPAPPSYVSCTEVCKEYKKSNQQGIEVGFTCDATLCTAASDPLLVMQACSGLGKSSLSEILKLEIGVGLSCSASQICGCEPKKKTAEEIYRLNKEQALRGIPSQCELNGTLCGTKP
jgi:hypothetical protein